MNNDNDQQKITALSVVIFSFISIALGACLLLLIDAISILLVLKTSLSENVLLIGSVVGSGFGIIAASAFLTLKAKIKGIFASIIIAGSVILIKVAGKIIFNLNGYVSLNTIVGIIFVVIFALIGSIIGARLKR